MYSINFGEVNYVNCKNLALDNILSELRDVFGKELKNENVTPKFIRARPVPFASR